MLKKIIAGVLSTTFVLSSVMFNQVIDVPEKLNASAMYIDSDFDNLECAGVTKSDFYENIFNYEMIIESHATLKMADFFEASILPDTLKYDNVKEIEQLGKNIISFVTSYDYVFIYGYGDMYNFNASPFENVGNIKEVYFYDANPDSNKYITSIGSYLFAEAKKLETFYLTCNAKSDGDKITSIGNHAFYNCENLKHNRRSYKDTRKSFYIPIHTTYIGDYAFYNCKSANIIGTFSSCIVEIGEYAFSHCEKLSSVKLYNNVKTIKDHAFEYCNNITSVDLDDYDGVRNIGNDVFSHCDSIGDLELPSLSNQYLTLLKSIPDTLYIIRITGGTNVPSNAFFGRIALQNIVLNDTITNIGNNAFDGCSNLNYISLYYNNNYITDNEFWNTILIGTGNTPLYDALAKRSIEVNSKITKQPTDVIVPYGELVSYIVEAKGDGLTYQWQYSYDNGITWKNTSAASGKTANLKFLLEGSNKSRLYRCKITDRYGKDITSNSVSLTVIHPLEITSQPADVTVSSGEYVSYTVNATGDKLTYQWQYSYDNGETWKDTSAATGKTANLNFYLNGSKKNRLYRCMITDQYGQTKFSNSAKLIVITK